jgi:hypothetical protein
MSQFGDYPLFEGTVPNNATMLVAVSGTVYQMSVGDFISKVLAATAQLGQIVVHSEVGSLLHTDDEFSLQDLDITEVDDGTLVLLSIDDHGSLWRLMDGTATKDDDIQSASNAAKFWRRLMGL